MTLIEQVQELIEEVEGLRANLAVPIDVDSASWERGANAGWDAAIAAMLALLRPAPTERVMLKHGEFLVICKDDAPPGKRSGRYVLATSRRFPSLKTADDYAARLARGRKPIVVGL